MFTYIFITHNHHNIPKMFIFIYFVVNNYYMNMLFINKQPKNTEKQHFN